MILTFCETALLVTDESDQLFGDGCRGAALCSRASLLNDGFIRARLARGDLLQFISSLILS